MKCLNRYCLLDKLNNTYYLLNQIHREVHRTSSYKSSITNMKDY